MTSSAELRRRLDAAEAALDEDPGETARKWVGEHFHQIKGALADALNGASVGGERISPERAGQLATLCMARMSHVYPDPPWQADIDDALHRFAEEAQP